MRSLLACVLAAVLLAGGLHAQFEVTVSGGVGDGRSGVADATITPALDPLWGTGSEKAFVEFKARHGELPDVEFSGSGTSKANGAYQFTLTIKASDESKLPVDQLRKPDGTLEDRYRVPVLLTAVKTGFRQQRQVQNAYDGAKLHAYFKLEPSTVLKGQVVHLKGREPAPNLKLVLHRRYWDSTRLLEDFRWEFTTDANGNIAQQCDELPFGRFSLSVAGSEYAFGRSSKAWQAVDLKPGNVELGTLVVVPGGGLSGFPVHMDTLSPLQHVYGQLKAAEENDRFFTYVNCNAEGDFAAEGIPAGRYTLELTSRTTWVPPPLQVTIEAGKVTALGQIACEPRRELEIFVPGIERFRAQAQYTGDTPPHGALERGREAYTVQADLTAEKCRLGGMFGGEWVVRVSADGYAESVVFVTLPVSEPITVRLEPAGAINARAVPFGQQRLSLSWPLAIREGTPAFESLSALDYKQLEPYFQRSKLLPVGAYRPESKNNIYTFTSLPAGTYLLLANESSFGLIRTEGVVVKTGETTDAEIQPAPGRLRISVLRSGAAAAQCKICVMADGVVTTLTTDDSGVAVFESRRYTSAWLLTTLEAAWVEAHRDPNSARTSENFHGREFRVIVNRVEEAKFELESKERLSVRVKLKLPERQKAEHGNLTGQEHNTRNSAHSSLIDGELVFVGISPGKYRLTGRVATAVGSRGHFAQEVEVAGAGEQLIEVKVVLPQLEVFIEAPGISMENVRYSFTRENDPDEWREREERWFAAPRDGRIVRDCLSPANYIVRVQALDAKGEVTASVLRLVTVSEDARIDLLLDDNVGSLDIEVTGKAAKTHRIEFVPVTVHIQRDDGSFVQPSDPTQASNNSWKFKVPGVPVGTYRVTVTGPDFQPMMFPMVYVGKHKATPLKGEPALAGSLELTTEKVVIKRETRVRWIFEDENGKEVDVLLPNGQVASHAIGTGRNTLTLRNLTPAVKQVRVQVDGYKDLVVKVDVKAGETIKQEVTFETK